jgi:phosphopantothenate synthetase
MAIGDDATAAGYSLVADTDELNEGAEEINLTRDYIAQEKTARIAADALKFDAAKVIISASTPAVVNGALWVKPL